MANDLKIGILGGGGRMGQMNIRQVAMTDGCVVAGVTARPGSVAIGQDAGELAGIGALGVKVTDDAAEMIAGVDVVIDFTSPAASLHHAGLAAAKGTAMVIGTTGLDAEEEVTLKAMAKDNIIIYCANTSVGVTLLTQLVEEVAAKLTDGWDIEILETHHHHKVDAPSGTALALGKAAAKGRGVALDDVADMVRKGQAGARKQGDIGFAVLRGGDVAGEHSVIFYGDAERVEISHRATDRAIFARGAIRAARFAATASSGFYDMTDVLKG